MPFQSGDALRVRLMPVKSIKEKANIRSAFRQRMNQSLCVQGLQSALPATSVGGTGFRRRSG